MVVEHIKSKKEFDEAIKNNGIVIVDFSADWCGPCKAISPRYEKLSQDYDMGKFVKIDVDQVSDVAHQFNIRAMPTFLIFRKGEKVAEIVGANPMALENAIRAATEPSTS